MPAGRPTNYNESILAKAQEYAINHETHGDPVPTIAGLSCELGVLRGVLYEWGKKHPEFNDTLEWIKSWQERKLVSKGLNNEVNNTIAKLMLANHGYSDRLDQNISSPDGSLAPTKIELVGVKAK